MFILVCVTVYKLIIASNICIAESTSKDIKNSMNCTEGTFYSQQFRACIPCSTCDIYSTMNSSCTATADTVCIKCTDTSQADLLNHPTCKQCPPCTAGEYLETPCSAEKTTVCRPCPEGSFNELASYRTHCFPCTSCENRIMIRDCNTSLDTECGRCRKGYYKDSNRNTCNRCLTCVPGQPVFEECKNGLPGKLCNEYFFIRTDFVAIPDIDQLGTISTLQTSTSASNISFLEKNTLEKSAVLGTALPATAVSLIVIVFVIVLLLKYLRLPRKKFGILDEEETVHYFGDSYDHNDDFPTSCSSNEFRIAQRNPFQESFVEFATDSPLAS